MLKKTLESFGIDKERVWFRFISASEGKKFAEIVDKMVQTLKKLGPNPTRTTWEL